MIALRLASVVAALVTITLNAAYGFKTSTVLEYAILFAALNAALDVAKCACLAGAARAWHDGQAIAAAILFILFWPLLANSLWCGLSEVAHNRAAEQHYFAADTQSRAIAAADHARASAELADLEKSAPYKSSTACVLPKTQRERTLCAQHAEVAKRLGKASTILTQPQQTDPSPQLTLLATWTGFDMATLLLATALWPIALAELTGSVGFYLTTRSDRTERRWNRFRPRKPPNSKPTPENAPNPAPSAARIQWNAIPS